MEALKDLENTFQVKTPAAGMLSVLAQGEVAAMGIRAAGGYVQ